MFCHGCGSFCPESWQFCSGCGTKVPSTSSDQEASARVAPTCSATSAIGNPSVAAPAPTRSAVGSVSFAAVPMPQVSESKPLSFEQFLKERKTTSSRFQLTKKKGKVVKAEKVKVSFHLTHYFYLQSVVGGGARMGCLEWAVFAEAVFAPQRIGSIPCSSVRPEDTRQTMFNEAKSSET